jgi:hypothetical protein
MFLLTFFAAAKKANDRQKSHSLSELGKFEVCQRLPTLTTN